MNSNKTELMASIAARVQFKYLGYEFTVLPRTQLKFGPLFSNRVGFNEIKAAKTGFAIILRPQKIKFENIKHKLKNSISLIHHTSSDKLYKIFNLINSILLG